METGLYYCCSRYYDPAIRRFISADDTQVLSDNLDMLGEKNLYAYCDDNPITRSDSDGQLWHKLVEIAAGAVIGAALNVVTGGIAATVTGQKYTAWDIAVAAASGAFAGAVDGAIGSIGGGIISAIYAGIASLSRGDSVLMAALNAGIAFGATTYIGNLTGFIKSVDIPKGAIGQKRTYNGKTKIYSSSFIYKSTNGKLVYTKRKSYHPGNARTV